MACAQLEVILADESVPAALADALRSNALGAAFRRLGETPGRNRLANVDALVLVLPAEIQRVARQLGDIFDELTRQPCPTVILTPTGRDITPPGRRPGAPITYARTDDAAGLAVRLETALAAGRALRALRERAAASRQADLNNVAGQVAQLRLTGQTQRSAQPVKLARCGSLTFSGLFRPANAPCGDICDVRRLDEDHVGVTLADTGGNAIAAALLTTYVRRAHGGAPGSVVGTPNPAEALESLNADLIAAQPVERLTVAASYAVINIRTLEVVLARAGAPHAVCRRRDGALEVIETTGSLLGAVPAARFEATRITLQSGDALLLYSDGLERLSGPPATGVNVKQALKRAANRIAAWNTTAARAAASHTVGAVSRQHPGGRTAAAVPPLTATGDDACLSTPTAQQTGPPSLSAVPWVVTLRQQGVEAALNTIADRHHILRRIGYPLDDLTVLAVLVDA